MEPTFAKYSDNAYFAKTDRIFGIQEKVNSKNQLKKDLIYSDNFFNTTSTVLEDVEFYKLTKCCVYAKLKDGAMKIADAFGWFYHFYTLKIEKMDKKTFEEFSIIDNEVLYTNYGSNSYNFK